MDRRPNFVRTILNVLYINFVFINTISIITFFLQRAYDSEDYVYFKFVGYNLKNSQRCHVCSRLRIGHSHIICRNIYNLFLYRVLCIKA
jgi:hypothetical protein